MKIVFKLNKKQFANARVIVDEVAKIDGDEDSYFCGNLIGWAGHSFSFNPRQCLELDLKSATVTYVGERHPLNQDGGLVTLLRIGTGFEPEKENSPKFSFHKKLSDAKASSWDFLEVVSYETSDTRLHWWETTNDFVWERATLDQWVSSKYNRGYERPNLGRMLTQDQKSCVDDIMRGKPLIQLMASYDAKTITIGKTIADFLGAYINGFQNKADKAILQAFNL